MEKPPTHEKLMPESRLRLVKPTLQTPFHIDFEWWKKNDRSWQVYLKSYLSEGRYR